MVSVWSEVQMICIWSSLCHCHPPFLASDRQTPDSCFTLTSINDSVCNVIADQQLVILADFAEGHCTS